jgi:hypothetical protein
MKEAIAISAIGLFFCVADASAEPRSTAAEPWPTGLNILSPSKIDVAYYSKRKKRWTRYSPGGDRLIGRGPYPDRLTPRGRKTGPIPRSARGG